MDAVDVGPGCLTFGEPECIEDRTVHENKLIEKASERASERALQKYWYLCGLAAVLRGRE